MKHGLVMRVSGLVAVVSLVGFVGSIGGGGESAGADPSVQPTFQGLNPARLYESRALPNNTVDGEFHPGAKVGPDSTTDVTVVGRGGVPATGVGSVALNVTVTGSETTSYLTVFPKGVPRPLASNLNMVANQTVANAVIVPVGTDGQVSLYNESGNTDLIVDVLGWFPSGPAVSGLTPARLLETRPAPNNTADGLFHLPGKVGPDSTTDVTVLGRGGVPASGVEAVAVNVTVTEPDTTSYITVFPTGQQRPTASNLNMARNATVPNLVIVPVGADGKISIYNESGNTNLIVDVVAYFQSGDSIEGLTPKRLFETRALPNNTVDGEFHPGAKVGPDSTTDVTVVGRGGVPATGVGAVALNVTVAEPEAQSYITVFPKGDARPTASNLNMVPNLTVANSVIVPVGDDGQVSFYNESGNTHLIVDVTAWFPTATIDLPTTTTTSTTSTTTTVPAPQASTQRVNLSSNPANVQSAQAGGSAEAPAISGLGQYAVFASASQNLVAGESDTDIDVFRRDLTSGETRKVSVRGGFGAGGGATEPAISADGRYIVFFSAATNIVSGAGGAAEQVFRADMSTTPPTIVLASQSTGGTQGNAESKWPSISGDGSKIAFVSQATNLIGSDTNGHWDVFLRTIPTVGSPSTTRVSVNNAGAQVDGTGNDPAGGSIDASISADGTHVAFTSDDSIASNGGGGGFLGIRQVYIRDLGGSTTTLVTTLPGSTSEAGVDGSGGGSFDPSLSNDGRFVMFHSSASDLIAVDPTPGVGGGSPVVGGEDVYWRDMQDSSNTAVKLVAANSSEPNDPLGANVMISGTGRYVVFSSTNASLVGSDSNSQRDVYRADMNTPGSPVITRVSVATGDVQATGGASSDPGVSADGARVVFISGATNLVAGDTNSVADVFVYNFP